jgi:hypothetical protein
LWNRFKNGVKGIINGNNLEIICAGNGNGEMQFLSTNLETQKQTIVVDQILNKF